MKNEKLVEATMLALRGKLNEWEEAYEDDYGEGITTRWYEVETDDGFLDTHFEDENEAIKVARTYKGNVFVYVTGSEKYTTGDYRGHSEPLDSVLLWQRKDGEEQKFGNSNAILEAKGSSKTYTCIEDGQGGDFAVGKTMTAEEWGEEAYSWAYNDDWTDPEEPLLKNFKTEQECLDFIQDMWEITIVPSDSPEAKEFLGEARSHKEDNERVAPRTVKNALGNDVETREMVDVSNPAVGNNSYKNEKGSQYWGTTHSEYASKRNKTGQKNEYGYDVYLAPFKNTGDWTTKADRMEPATATARYQYQKEQGETLKPDLKRYRDKEKRARNPENKEYWKNAADNIQKNIDDYDKKAKEIVNKERERIANKKATEARSHKEDNEKVAPRRQHSPYQREYGRVYGDLKDVPKRARFSANKGKASDWGYYDLNELDTYNKSTDDIEDYKRYKTDAENERTLARYHNANAQEKDDRASDIVRDKKLDRAKRNLKGQEIFDVKESKKVESEEDAINVMNNFRDKNALYGYVVSYLENNAPNNEEILKLCKEILAKGAINVCGKDKINDFYNKCKSDIEARINALGENYIKTILAQYVFEDVIYGLEDNLESAIQK